MFESPDSIWGLQLSFLDFPLTAYRMFPPMCSESVLWLCSVMIKSSWNCLHIEMQGFGKPYTYDSAVVIMAGFLSASELRVVGFGWTYKCRDSHWDGRSSHLSSEHSVHMPGSHRNSLLDGSPHLMQFFFPDPSLQQGPYHLNKCLRWPSSHLHQLPALNLQ